MRTIIIQGQKTTFSTGRVLSKLNVLSQKKSIFLLVDKQVRRFYAKELGAFPFYEIPSGEKYKSLQTARKIIDAMLDQGINRASMLVGIGGGVTTDMAGFVASIYMRGISFGFVPTTLLAMVDASLGGKNGLDWQEYKNMVGTITQPGFIHYDYSLLQSLSPKEWSCGFAEIIKHACIANAQLARELMRRDISYYTNHPRELKKLVENNIRIKCDIVRCDPSEKKERRLLNFGHTLAHIIERSHNLAHGEAVAIGMVLMARLSREYVRFSEELMLKDLIGKYGLPTAPLRPISKNLLDAIRTDKKRKDDFLYEIFLQKIGVPLQKKIPLCTYQQMLSTVL